jgi:putative ABC transport system substrate-binding protein
MCRAPLSTIRLRRRVIAVALAALLTPLAGSRAVASAGRVRRIAVLFWRISPAELDGDRPSFSGARQLQASLEQLGWREGQSLEILWRSAEGSDGRGERILRELMARPVDLIAASGDDAIRVAKRVTNSVPIVTVVSTKPVEEGFVKSLTRPAGNVTGVVWEIVPGTNGKRLAILKEAAPRVSTIAFLHDGTGGMSGGIDAQTETAIRKLHLNVLRYPVDRVDDLEGVITEAVARGAHALLVDTSVAAPAANHARLIALAERHGLPAMYTYAQVVESGGLFFYGPKQGELYVRAAHYIDRILRGAKPADLPMEQPREYAFIVNRKAAAAIRLSLPPSLLAQADKIID